MSGSAWHGEMIRMKIVRNDDEFFFFQNCEIPNIVQKRYSRKIKYFDSFFFIVLAQRIRLLQSFHFRLHMFEKWFDSFRHSTFQKFLCRILNIFPELIEQFVEVSE